MIGDREAPDDEVPAVDYGPLNAMLALAPPPGADVPPARVERYGTLVVVRHLFTGESGGVWREIYAPSVGHALHRYAGEVAALRGRGYTLATPC